MLFAITKFDVYKIIALKNAYIVTILPDLAKLIIELFVLYYNSGNQPLLKYAYACLEDIKNPIAYDFYNTNITTCISLISVKIEEIDYGDIKDKLNQMKIQAKKVLSETIRDWNLRIIDACQEINRVSPDIDWRSFLMHSATMQISRQKSNIYKSTGNDFQGFYIDTLENINYNPNILNKLFGVC